MPELMQNGIIIHKYSELTDTEQDACKAFFERFVLPMLTPLMVDPTHPFPFISNLSLNFAIILRRTVQAGSGERHFARLKIPAGLKRFVRVGDEMMSSFSGNDPPPLSNTVRFVLIEDVIRANLNMLFPGMVVEEAHLFRVTRDADVEIAEDEVSCLFVFFFFWSHVLLPGWRFAGDNGESCSNASFWRGCSSHCATWSGLDFAVAD